MRPPPPPLVTAGVAGAVVTGVVLGPALGPGLVQSYDLVWSPDPTVTPFALGVGTPAPRAVPSELVVTLLGLAVSAGVAQKLVLFGILLLAATGAAALLLSVRPDAGRLPTVTTAVAALWNPFVAERLVIGHWPVLLGYAVLPWALRALLRVPSAGVLPLCAWVVVAGLGGANAWVVVAPLVVLAAVALRIGLGPAATLAATALGSAAVWAVPALASRVTGDARGFEEFALRADGPAGLVVSALGGGGLWNASSHPPERAAGLLSVATAALLCLGALAVATDRTTRGRVALVGVAGAGLALAVLPALAGRAGLWDVAAAVPGGALLRDSHKLVAAWVAVAAVGIGVGVHRLVSRNHALVPLAALALLALPAMLPSLAWGVGGRLSAVAVPEDLSEAARVASGAGDGAVALLPWGQFRRYEWNDRRVSLSLVPRMVDSPVVFDDSLPLSSGRVRGEDPVAAEVTAALDSGADPWRVLADQGIRYAVVERGPGVATTPDPPRTASTLWSSDSALVVDLGPSVDGLDREATNSILVGWGIALVTTVFVLVGLARRVLEGAGGRRTKW
ncbi:hypothetical protein BCF74_10588 [Knoellia remsis]|uniref:Membrane protein YfhO n=1 Tax=Knoellia remsis TaxID=407159 RepID=A0A2T0UUD6_9MICO|nr:hypothetical protein [Knoellia remsis]PRY61530.1 hypothetical protein BCF74_10588 [Knoellia remsis]